MVSRAPPAPTPRLAVWADPDGRVSSRWQDLDVEVQQFSSSPPNCPGSSVFRVWKKY